MPSIAVLRAPEPLRPPQVEARALARSIAREAAHLDAEGTLWLFARNAHRRGRFVPWPWLLHDAVRPASGLRLRNVLVRLAPGVSAKPFGAAHELVLMLVRDPARHRFDKAQLRVPHAFEGLEWGQRSRGRTGYHAEGPGAGAARLGPRAGGGGPCLRWRA
ncbi:MAG: hypothetical protein LC624_05860 [Halobacteriales archaeon]|nr:hypothetical protein [Halobacteriales archaeon]